MAGKRGKRVRRQAKRPSLAVRKACFLEVLRQTGIVSRAAREAAMDEALDEVEARLIERARFGVEKPVYYRGEIVGNVRSYSDQLAMFLLKARRPEVYDRLSGGEARGAAMRTITDAAAKVEVLRRLDRLTDQDDDGDA